MKRFYLAASVFIIALVLASFARAQLFGFGQKKKPNELISKQAPMKINNKLLGQASSENTRIAVSIPKQRAYLMIGEQVVADAPVSSGKRGHETPHGRFNVMEKDPNHYSSL